MKLLITLSLLFFFGLSQAQVNVQADPRISMMVSADIQNNKSSEFVSGWRVLIVSSSDRTKIMNTKAAFLGEFPRIKAEWTYTDPYYKLKAGAFLSKLEAAKLLYKIKKKYPGATIIRDDKIRPRDF